MALRISRVAPRGSDGLGEWVGVRNTGPAPEEIAGKKLTDYTVTQQEVHIYTFPAATADGKTTRLDAQETAFVFTGIGRDRWVTGKEGGLELHLFMGRHANVWNNDGDVAYLRNADGTFIHSMTVGEPRRHPGR